MSVLFQRKKEDFVCEKCGLAVVGNGFTNHCPQCLWSKHVDVNPGDRAATCGGLMEPVRGECEKGRWVVTQRCSVCNHERRNGLGKEDNFDVLVQVAKKDQK